MILFGSQVTGKPRKDSILIVSKKFEGMDTRKRSLGLYQYWTIDAPFDFICYSTQEFEKLKNKQSLVSEAVSHGVEI